MRVLRRILTTIAISATLALTVALATSTPAAAYGSDAVYQLEFSFNCNNPSSDVCTNEFGTGGGAWGWIELDSETHPGTSGDADIVIAFCDHGRFEGPPFGGAGSVRVDGVWFIVDGIIVISVPSVPELGVLIVPAAPGHYSMINDPVVGATAVFEVVRIPGR
jgi:hypothetical protein